MNNSKFAETKIIQSVNQIISKGFSGNDVDLINEISKIGTFILNEEDSIEIVSEYGYENAVETAVEFEETSFGFSEIDVDNTQELASMLFLAITNEFVTENFETLVKNSNLKKM